MQLTNQIANQMQLNYQTNQTKVIKLQLTFLTDQK